MTFRLQSPKFRLRDGNRMGKFVPRWAKNLRGRPWLGHGPAVAKLSHSLLLATAKGRHTVWCAGADFPYASTLRCGGYRGVSQLSNAHALS